MCTLSLSMQHKASNTNDVIQVTAAGRAVSKTLAMWDAASRHHTTALLACDGA